MVFSRGNGESVLLDIRLAGSRGPSRMTFNHNMGYLPDLPRQTHLRLYSMNGDRFEGINASKFQAFASSNHIRQIPSSPLKLCLRPPSSQQHPEAKAPPAHDVCEPTRQTPRAARQQNRLRRLTSHYCRLCSIGRCEQGRGSPAANDLAGADTLSRPVLVAAASPRWPSPASSLLKIPRCT